MATASLPEQPNLEQLRKRARELQRAVQVGDRQALAQTGHDGPRPDYSLSSARLDLARHYGFPNWTRLYRHVETIRTRSWSYSEPPGDEAPTQRFLRLACLNYADDSPARWAEAARLLGRQPQLTSTSPAVAAASADVAAVRRHLRSGARAATARVAPHDWSPLMYLAYARVDVDLEATLATARLLLDAGADPDDGRFFGGLPTPFTVLTGVFGGGETGQPPHPHSVPLARILLEAGAEPNDGQVLYNRMFGSSDDFLDVLFEFGLGQGDGGVWRRLLPDLPVTPTTMLRDLLDWAVTHDQRERVALLARHGVDVVSPLGSGATPIEVALLNGHRALAEQLRRLGADDPTLDAIAGFIAAALAGDSAAVATTSPDVVAEARRTRPALVVWATSQDRIDAVELLVAAGFDVNAFGRSDVPIEQEWQSALHTAVERGNAPLVRRLLELGADSSVHDTRFDATPLDWARHFQRPELAELLSESAG